MEAIGPAATVAQLVGNAGGIFSKTRRTAETARQNKVECQHLERRVSTIDGVLPGLPEDPQVKQLLEDLRGTLREAEELVVAWQKRSATTRLFRARRHADKFREVNARIDAHLSLFPLVGYAAIAGRLDRLFPPGHTSVPLATTSAMSSLGSGSSSQRTQTAVSDYPRMFKWAVIVTATDNFAVELGRGSSGRVYKGRLHFHHGTEVAVKVLEKHGRQSVEDAFVAESNILSGLRHDHIVRLIGWCAEEEYRMLVYEHMGKGTLRDHLQHLGGGPSCWSPVRTSWRTRVEVLLGAARAINYLHRGADPLVIHRNVSSSNILLDASCTPRLSGFGSAVFQEAGREHDGQPVAEVVGTFGYIDPEYSYTMRVGPATDVYSFGVVMLEALTGRPPVIYGATLGRLVDSALPSIQNGRLRDMLDGLPAPRPTPRQLEALDLVAHTASRCLSPRGQDRLAMSEVVANLERALEIIRSNEPMSWASII